MTDTTVVIPAWNSLTYLPRCLDELATHSPDTPIVVVDNGSQDGTVAWLAKNAPAVHVIANTDNEGFGAACNRGAEAAATEWVCFLNADAFVQAGWLDELHAQLARIPRAENAVPMFINEDGSLQEAGGLVFASGATMLYGSDHRPSRWRYRFPRVIDYGSAACLLSRRRRFLELGGFDVETYGLAYFEDIDYCFRAAAHGDRTVYAPRAIVVHVRNASSSSEAVHQLGVRNRDRFADRYRRVLKRRPVQVELGPNPHKFIAARDADRFERLLIAVRDLPDLDSSLGRRVAAIQVAWPNCRIAIATDSPPTDAQAEAWLECGIEVGDEHNDWYGWLRDRVAYFTTAVAVGEDALTRFGALVELTQVDVDLLSMSTAMPASRWRAFSRSRDRYKLGAPITPGRWLALDPEADLVTTLVQRGWPSPEVTPESI
jgi:GT2 family glycosyltransferase